MKKLRETLNIIIEIIFEDGRTFIAPIISILGGVLVFIIISKGFFNDKILDDKADTTKLVLLILTMTVVIMPIVIKFLYTDRDRKYEDELITYKKLKEESNKAKIVSEQIKEALLKNPEILNVEKSIYDKVISNLEISLITKLNDRFKKNVETEFVSNAIISELIPLTRNTEKYIDRIQRNSIVNIMIGIIGTVTSIFILAFSILSDKMYSDISIFAIHFLPRVTFVVFIQLFAFFFLRLYKNNLEDAKYFQNELTNLSAKTSALRIAYITKNEPLIVEIIKDLSNTERNFKLQKEETLLNIEKAKIEKDFDLEMLVAFKDFMKTYKK